MADWLAEIGNILNAPANTLNAGANLGKQIIPIALAGGGVYLAVTEKGMKQYIGMGAAGLGVYLYMIANQNTNTTGSSAPGNDTTPSNLPVFFDLSAYYKGEGARFAPIAGGSTSPITNLLNPVIPAPSGIFTPPTGGATGISGIDNLIYVGLQGQQALTGIALFPINFLGTALYEQTRFIWNLGGAFGAPHIG